MLRGPTVVRGIAATWLALAGFLIVGKLVGSDADAPTTRETPGAVDVLWEVEPIEETFDALPMNANLPAPWKVSGDGTVQVAALPTSVDRSIRIASDAEGHHSVACRVIARGTSDTFRVALDFLLGREPVQDVKLLELANGDVPLVRMMIDAADGRIFASPGPSGGAGASSFSPGAPAGMPPRVDAGAWRRLDMTVTDRGVVSWQSHATSGADTGSGTVALGAGVEALPDTLCLASPAGSPAAWVAVDDLLIEG